MNHPRTPALTTNALLLRNLLHSDVLALFSLRSNPVVNKYLLRKADITADDSAHHIEKILSLEKTGNCYYWAIQLKSIPTLIGTICLWNFDENKFTAELGYEILPSYFGQGLVSEAVGEVLQFAKKQEFKSISAFVDSKNEASKRVLTKQGFELITPNHTGGEDLLFTIAL